MREIIFIFFALIDVYLFDYFLKKTFSIKINRSFHKALLMIIYMITAYVYVNNIQHFMFIYITFMLYSYLIFQISFFKSLIICIIYYVICLCSFIISFFFIDITYQVTISQILIQRNLKLLSMAMNEIVKYGIIIFFISFINLRKRKLRLPTLCVFVILPISTLLIMLGSTNYLSQSHTFSTVFLLGTLGLLITNVSMLYVVNRIVKGNEAVQEYEVLRVKKEYECEYLQMLERYRKDTRVYMHDFYKHIRVMNQLVNENKQEELKTYLFELTMNTDQIKHQFHSGIEELDIILNSYSQQLQTNHITLKLQTHSLDVSWIKLMDFNAIITNLLDNALESCMKCENRFIVLGIVQYGEQCIRIKMENSCRDAKFQNHEYVTTKDDSECHGLGLLSISRIVQLYHGSCKFEFQANKNTFVSIILLELS